MGISLTRPWFLLLLLPAGVLLAVFSCKHRFLRSSGYLVLGLRGLAITALVLALTQPHLTLPVKERSFIYLLDQSSSMEPGNMDWVKKSLEAKGPQDRTAIIGFGRDTSLLKPFYMDQLPTITATVDEDFTSLARALESGYSLLPGNGGRLILISDGQENIGDCLKVGEMLAAAGVPVDVVPVATKTLRDAAVTNISFPKNTWPGQQVVADVTVESTIATAAALKVYMGGSLEWQQQLNISPGVQSFTVPLTVDGSGFQRVRATIEPAIDDQGRNNRMDSFTFVQSPPRLLIVEGVGGKGAALKRALENSGLMVDALVYTKADLDPVALASYRGVVLVDLPAYELKDAEIESLDTFVGVLGGGLIAVGGKSSFGPGLYGETLLETMLPVKMTIEEQEEVPGMDMVLIIDRSSSMSGEKLNMAKSASIKALEVLKDSDRLAVVTFDTAHQVELPLTPLDKKEKIVEVIASISVGGGTAIHTGLSQGVQMLTGEGDKVKHIILLSDGQDGTAFNYNPLLEQARAQKISISTIALGDGADLKLMEQIAQAGNGRSYFVRQEKELPAVFLQETVLAGGEWLVEEDFVPNLLHPDAFALGMPPPGFHGYVASTAKGLAEVLLTTHRDHPLLARWQYGLGRTVAFTSDTFGLWSNEFLAHPGFASFWLDMVNWVAPPRGGSDIALESRREGAGIEISALLTTPLDEGEQLTATLVDAQGEINTLELLPVGYGRYQGSLEQIPQGVYLLSASRLAEGKIISHAQGGFAIPYPAEYSIHDFSGETLLTALAEKTGGRVLASPEEVFSLERVSKRQLTDITWWLLLVSVLVWPADIAIRRLGGLPRFPALKKRRKCKPTETEEEADAVLERLLAAKDRR